MPNFKSFFITVSSYKFLFMSVIKYLKYKKYSYLKTNMLITNFFTHNIFYKSLFKSI